MKTILSLMIFLVCTSFFCTGLVYSQSVSGLKQVEKTETQGRTDPEDGDPCPGQPTITDSEGNVYNTVLIGETAQVYRYNGPKLYVYSVRCLKDETAPPTTYNLNLEVNPIEAGTATGQGQYEAEELADITAEANPGWAFVNWTDDDGIVCEAANFTYTMPAEDITLTANFAEDEPRFSCGSSIMFTYRGQAVSYGTIARGGLCWMDRNLGASRVPISFNDSEGYGDLFQWGRLDDWHQDKTSSTTQGAINRDVPGHDKFIRILQSPWDWRYLHNNALWQGANGINNPCPLGWRVPTEAELNAERLSWDSHSSAGAYTSTLKWPVGGYRSNFGEVGGVDSFGRVWSSSVSLSNARFLAFDSISATMASYRRACGMSVRCVRDESVVIIPNETTIQDLTVVQDQDTCFNAINGITVLDFVVHPGGSATFIAGGSISFQQGTTVMQEGHLHAYITTDSSYCIQPAAMLAVKKPAEIFENQIEEQAGKECFFKVYPNPTTGDFTLELHGFEESKTVLVQIFSMQGNLLSAQELLASSLYNMSLAGSQPGIYLIRVVMNGQTGVAKAVKK